MKNKKRNIEALYLEQEELFEETIPDSEKSVLKEIDKILDALNSGHPLAKNTDERIPFETWNGTRLISAEEKLSRYSETLGEYIKRKLKVDGEVAVRGRKIFLTISKQDTRRLNRGRKIRGLEKKLGREIVIYTK